jgi:N-acetyl-gamma-glutamyl-phosphate reductase
MTHRIAILGASGYAGGELIRLIDAHPAFVAAHLGAHSKAGSTLETVHPQLTGGERTLGSLDPAEVPDVDIAFLALPHGASATPAMDLVQRGIRVIDLGSDFRLDSTARYEAAYGSPHPHPEELGKWPYGLPELFADRIAGSDRVAAPGCYPTSALLALAPLYAAGLIRPEGITVDSLSGVSGAGRGAKENLMFGAVDESVAAYGVLSHRHQSEMEQGLGAVGATEPQLIFTPHLVPMQRGILSTCYATLSSGANQTDVHDALEAAYREAPFVDVIDRSPQTRWVVGTNRVLLAAQVDSRTGRVVVLAAIDNLIKGAAGQAVQCANLMMGLDETTGLITAGWMP